MLLDLFTFIIGAVFGNLVTSAYHRIPVGKPMKGSGNSGVAPHCASCGTSLRFYEYYPIFSWISTFRMHDFKFRCNYCNVQIPIDYFIIEILTACVSVGIYKYTGMNNIFIISLLIFSAFLLNISLFIKNRSLFKKSAFILCCTIFISLGVLFK